MAAARIVLHTVGRCIYCNRDDVPLHEEHVIAFALGGHLVLPEASCEACGKETGKDEQKCIRGILAAPRLLYPRSSRKSKKPPKTLKLRKVRIHGASNPIPQVEFLDEAEARFERVPFFVRSIALAPPGMIANRELDDLVYPTDFLLDATEETIAWLKEQEVQGFRYIQGPYNPGAFSRMIAKIAHGYAVAKLGLNTFEAYLPAVVLQRHRHVSHFVGGSDNALPTDGLHKLHIRFIDGRTDQGESIQIIVVDVRLYSSLHTPTFMAIAGRWPAGAPWPPPLRSIVL